MLRAGREYRHQQQRARGEAGAVREAPVRHMNILNRYGTRYKNAQDAAQAAREGLWRAKRALDAAEQRQYQIERHARRAYQLSTVNDDELRRLNADSASDASSRNNPAELFGVHAVLNADGKYSMSGALCEQDPVYRTLRQLDEARFGARNARTEAQREASTRMGHAMSALMRSIVMRSMDAGTYHRLADGTHDLFQEYGPLINAIRCNVGEQKTGSIVTDAVPHRIENSMRHDHE